MPSWQSKAIGTALRLFINKAKVSSPEWTRAHVAALSLRPASYAPPKYLDKTTTLTVDHHNGWPLYQIGPRTGPAERRVLYLHGGAYTEEILAFHWWLIATLARKVPAQVAVPVYPLAPRGRAAEVVPAVTGILARMIDESGPENVILMGDSAGGGMALAAAEHLRDHYGVQPARTVLISPWLDVTMTHPDQARIAPRDPMLARSGLAESGRLYAGTLDTTDPLVSPLYGKLDGLAPLTVFCGTHDLLLTDSRILAQKAAAAGVPVDYHEADGLLHVYPLMPVPEGRAARDAIINACRHPNPGRGG